MDVNCLPKTVTRQRRGCDLNPDPSASSTLTTRLPSHPHLLVITQNNNNKVAIETAGTWNQMAVELVQEIGRRITLVTEDSACPLPFNGEMRSSSSARSLPPINHPLQSFLA